MKKKINVLLVSHDSCLNGAPRSMVNLATSLRKYGVNPYILIPYHGDIEKELIRHRLKYFIIPYNKCFRVIGNKNLFYECFKEFNNYVSLIKIISLIKKLKIDIIHSNSLAVDVGAMASYICRCKHIWHIREFMEEDFGFEHYFKKKIEYLIGKSDKVIAISEAINKKYSKLYHLSDIITIYNGLPVDKYEIKNKELFPEPYINLIISGTICEGKGQIEAIEMMEQLMILGYKNIYLYIVGSGSIDYVNQLKNTVKNKGLLNNIRFLGFKNDMQQIRNKMDIELVCSKNEAFGRVTVEAMLSNLLVIAANTGGTREIVKDKVNGLLYKQGSVTDLEKKVLFALENRNLITQYIHRAKVDANNLFNITNTVQNVIKVYESLIGR
ncbi:glycosyltransferase [Anaerocolumna sedimenticola]|uniref:Glycosyltransferase n=1 Tax=Anaerocolumna sedimenticola TaxID=2696063 RepID=A0A6P1TMX3_9FIRM|nr:glycosyltransferase family 4 protein [Anaerocolumna sedimenticola]QHQ60688.1 glycosyltransferase [Anaerocolumna sedimenticola]